MYSASALSANTAIRSAVAAAFPLFTVQLFTNVSRLRGIKCQFVRLTEGYIGGVGIYMFYSLRFLGQCPFLAVGNMLEVVVSYDCVVFLMWAGSHTGRE